MCLDPNFQWFVILVKEEIIFVIDLSTYNQNQSPHLEPCYLTVLGGIPTTDSKTEMSIMIWRSISAQIQMLVELDKVIGRFVLITIISYQKFINKLSGSQCVEQWGIFLDISLKIRKIGNNLYYRKLLV